MRPLNLISDGGAKHSHELRGDNDGRIGMVGIAARVQLCA